MPLTSNYNRYPQINVSGNSEAISQGFSEICSRLAPLCLVRSKTILSVESYPGVNQTELLEGLRPLSFAKIINSDSLTYEPEKMDRLLKQDMTDDPVFGIMTNRSLKDFFYPEKIAAVRAEINAVSNGVILIYGVGASLVHPGDIRILADITRWEIQLR